MAKSPVVEDESDSTELSDADETSAMEKIRHMIRRPDWFEVFKKQSEEQNSEKSDDQRTTEKALEVSLSDTEDISVSESETISTPRQSRLKRRSPKNTAESESVCVSEPTVQKRRQRKAAKKSTKSKHSPWKPSRRASNKDTVCNAVGGRTRRSRRCVRTNTSQNVDPQIVFLSDDEPELSACGASNNAIPEFTANTASSVSLDDSIEIISETRETVNGKEIDFENREINILFCWQNKIVTLPMKQDAQFGTVFPKLLNDWKIHEANVMLLYQDKIIKAGDTPSDHEMLSGSIVECSVVKSKTSLDVRDPNVITIKLQMKNSRNKKEMIVNQMSQFRSIIERFAKEEGVPVNKITFKFDGDTISHRDTPFDLGIENDFSIDVTY